MALQAGHMFLTGTLGGIIYYKMDGKYYARTCPGKWSKWQKRRRKGSNTMRNARWFALSINASKQVYRLLPKAFRHRFRVWYPMQAEALELVRLGKSEGQIIE